MTAAHRVLLVAATSLAVLAAVTGTSLPASRGVINAAALARDIEHQDDHVTGIELAEWIRSRKPGLRVIDVRPDSEYAAYHVAGAERKSLPQLAAMVPKGGETLVLYSEGGAHAAQGWVLLRSLGFTNVYFLRGGLLEWMGDVMNPLLPDSLGNAAGDSARAHVAALSRYFGGVPSFGRAMNAVEGSAAQAVARVRRRGC